MSWTKKVKVFPKSLNVARTGPRDGSSTVFFIVARGTGPRDFSSTVFYRSAGACPPRSPSSRDGVLGPLGPEENKRRFLRSARHGEGQALALREGVAFFLP